MVASAVKGKKVKDAILSLKFLGKKAALPIEKLINSAQANAKERNLNIENLRIKEIRVDNGSILYRRGSASHGRAPLIRKRTSHIRVVLTDNEKISKRKGKLTELTKNK